jgi:hypothetical protein
MRAMRFTVGAGLVVACALLLVGAAVTALGLVVDELPESPQSFSRLAGYLIAAALCAGAGLRVLRSGAAPRTGQRP